MDKSAGCVNVFFRMRVMFAKIWYAYVISLVGSNKQCLKQLDLDCTHCNKVIQHLQEAVITIHLQVLTE